MFNCLCRRSTGSTRWGCTAWLWCPPTLCPRLPWVASTCLRPSSCSWRGRCTPATCCCVRTPASPTYPNRGRNSQVDKGRWKLDAPVLKQMWSSSSSHLPRPQRLVLRPSWSGIWCRGRESLRPAAAIWVRSKTMTRQGRCVWEEEGGAAGFHLYYHHHHCHR